MTQFNNFTSDTPLLSYLWDAKNDKGTNSPPQKPSPLRVPEERKSKHRHRKAASLDFNFTSTFVQNLQ